MHFLIYIVQALVLSWFITPGHALESKQYLERERLVLPMEMTSVHTVAPLDPAHQYRIVFTSNYNLRPFLAPQFCTEESYEIRRFWRSETFVSTTCYPPLLFDGLRLDTSSSTYNDLGSFFLEAAHTRYYVSVLTFYFWGTGRMLTIQTGTDLSDVIPEATLDIIDVTVAETERKRQKDLEQLRQKEVAAEQAADEQQEREEQAHQEHVRQEEAERVRLIERQRQQHLQFYSGVALLSAIAVPCVVFGGWWFANTPYREAAEAEVVRQQQLVNNQKRDAAIRLAVFEHKMEVLKQEELLHAKNQEKEDRYHHRVEQLDALYSNDALFGYRRRADNIEHFARTHAKSLMKERDDILNAYKGFHEDIQFIYTLQSHRPWLYECSEEVYKYRALAVAERLTYQPDTQADKPKETKEQWRARMTKHALTTIEDDAAQMFVAFASVEAVLSARATKTEEIEARDDLTDDDKTLLVQAIEAMTEQRMKNLTGGQQDAFTSPDETPPPFILGTE